MRDQTENPILLAALGAAGLFLGRQLRPAVPTSGAPARTGQTPTSPAKKERAFRSREPEAAEPAAPADNSWWAILKRVAAEISANQLMTQAAAVTFYALLSLFPALAALVSIYGLIADPQTIVEQVNTLSALLPGGGQELLIEQLKTLTATKQGLGWGLILGVGTSLWTSNQAMKAIFNALNAVHETKEMRGFIRLTAITLACTAGVILFMAVALTAVVVLPAVIGSLGLSGLLDQVVKLARWPLLLVCVALLLAVLYRFGPCRDKVVWRWVSSGSAFAAVAWVVVSVLFSWYVSNFGNYNKTYGSLGAVVGFMTWIWISCTVVLIGAQLDAELEKSTVGPQQRKSSNQKVRTLQG